MVRVTKIARLLIHDEAKHAGQRNEFVRQFTLPDAKEISQEEAASFLPRALDAVRGSLAKPESATFADASVRRCSDTRVRAVGIVTFARLHGDMSGATYLVEFDVAGHASLLDLTDVDPQSIEKLAADQWDDTFFAPVSAAPAEPAKRDPFWPIFWTISAVVIISLLLFRLSC